MTLPLFPQPADPPPAKLELRRVSARQATLSRLVGRCWNWSGSDQGPACKIVIEEPFPADEVPAERAALFSWSGVQFWLVGAPRLFQVLCGFDPWMAESDKSGQQVEPGWALREVTAVLNNLWFGHSGDWVRPMMEASTWSARWATGAALPCSIWSHEGVWLDRFWLIPTELPDDMRMAGLLTRSGLQAREQGEQVVVPLRVPAVVGEVTLTAQQLGAVEVGDALCFTRSFMTGWDRITLQVGQGTLAGRFLSAHQMEIESVFHGLDTDGSKSMDEELQLGDLSLTSPDTEPAHPGLGRALFDVPVTLQAVAGELKLNLADLARLQPGDVFNLEQPASPFVRLMVNGKELGVGELVEIDGKLGVQVSRWDSEGGRHG